MLLLVILLFSKHSAEGLCSKQAGICLTEQIRVLGKLHSGLNCEAVGHELNVNESTMSIK